MTNQIIDIKTNTDLNKITASPGGSLTHDVQVVIRSGVTTSEAHKALLAITAALIGDNIQLD